jgi:hypothetical protein
VEWRVKVIPTTGTIKAVVRDDAGNYLRDARVYLDGSYKGETDSSGTLYIRDVGAGLHTVKASKPGYEEDSKTVTVRADATETVYLTLKRIPTTGTIKAAIEIKVRKIKLLKPVDPWPFKKGEIYMYYGVAGFEHGPITIPIIPKEYVKYREIETRDNYKSLEVGKEYLYPPEFRHKFYFTIDDRYPRVAIRMEVWDGDAISDDYLGGIPEGGKNHRWPLWFEINWQEVKIGETKSFTLNNSNVSVEFEIASHWA